MKIFSSFLWLFCATTTWFVPTSVLALSIPDPYPTPHLDAFDYFNFAAMRTSPAGNALRERIFEDLKNAPETAELIRVLNADYTANVPESVDRATLARFSVGEKSIANLAVFNFSAPQTRLYSAFENKGNSRAAVLPEILRSHLPAYFTEGTPNVLVFGDSSRRRICLIASNEIAPPPAPEALPKHSSDVLIFRKFPRRDVRNENLNLSFPAGDFTISEKNGTTEISVRFQCETPQESDFLERFFTRFKTSMLDAARTQPESTATALRNVGAALKISRTPSELRVRISCPSEDFPAFLKWRKLWRPDVR